MAEIKIRKKVKINRPLVMVGFYSPGLIGTLVSQYIVKKEDAEQIGYIKTDLPPVAMISKGRVEHPVRIYYAKKKNAVVISSELPIPHSKSKDIAESIIKWVKKTNGEILCVEGMVSPKSRDIYVVSSKNLKTGMKSLGEGIIMGLTGALLLGSYEENVPITCIIAETQSIMPDGRISAKAINEMNKIFGWSIDTKPLLKETELFEKKLKKLEYTKQDMQEPSRIYG